MVQAGPFRNVIPPGDLESPAPRRLVPGRRVGGAVAANGEGSCLRLGEGGGGRAVRGGGWGACLEALRSLGAGWGSACALPHGTVQRSALHCARCALHCVWCVALLCAVLRTAVCCAQHCTFCAVLHCAAVPVPHCTALCFSALCGLCCTALCCPPHYAVRAVLQPTVLCAALHYMCFPTVHSACRVPLLRDLLFHTAPCCAARCPVREHTNPE